MQLFGKGYRFFGVTHIGFCNNLNQRCAGTVQVDTGHAVIIFMQALAGIFFQMSVMNANGFSGAVFQGDLNVTRTDNGLLQLSGLVAFGRSG